MWLRATSSTESAMTSRLISEPFMPSVPIVMPSVIEIVLTSMGVPPAARTPCITFSASFRWFQLQGIVPIQLWATPICGRARSSSEKPTAFIMARAAARSVPSSKNAALRARVHGHLWLSFGKLSWEGILQQVAEWDQREAPLAKRVDQRGQRLDEASARAGHAVGVMQVDDRAR